VIRKIPATVASKPSMAYPMLMSLFEKPHGNIRFDAVTRSKTVEGIVAALPEQDIGRYVAWLAAFVLQAGNDAEEDEEEEADPEDEELLGQTSDKAQKTIENNRAWAIDQLLLLIRKKTISFARSEAEAAETLAPWAVAILDFLIVHGFFSLEKATKKTTMTALHEKPTTAISPATQAVCRARFFSALTHLLSINPRCRSQVWTSKALETMRTLQKDEKHLKCLAAQDTLTELAIILSLHDRVAKTDDERRRQASMLLTEVLLLQSCDPDGDALDLLEELSDAIKSLFFAPKQKAKASKTDDGGEAAEPVSVLIDLLVNLLQKPSVLLRTTAERVFAAFSSEVGGQALQLLTDQIAPSEIVEEDMEVDEHNAEDGAGESGSDSGDDGEDDESDEDSDADGDDIDLDADPELRDKVAAALKSMGMGGDDDEDNDEAEAEDGEADEDEDDLLDDDQMMQLDEQLAEIFKSRKTMANENRAEQENTLNSQLRVVDLLEIYAKQLPASPLLLQTILPLFDLACKTSGDKDELASKAAKVLRGIVNKPKDIPGLESPEDAIAVLDSVHALARKYSNGDSIPLAAATSAYLSRTILASTGERAIEEVSAIYSTSLNDYLIKKHTRVHHTLFANFAQRQPLAAWTLREQLLDACSESTETKDKHKRMQMFGVLGDLISAFALLKTSESSKELLAYMPKVVATVQGTLDAAAEGKGMQLQVARLREVLKFCQQAIRATKQALSTSGSKETIEQVWQTEKTSLALNQLSTSSHVSSVSSLNTTINQVIASISPSSTKVSSTKKAKASQQTAQTVKKRKAEA